MLIFFAFIFVGIGEEVKPLDSPRETNLAEDDRITIFGEKRHEKSEIVKRRPRAILAATPMLEEIPEEKGHGSGSDTNSVRASEESRKAKKNKKQVFVFVLTEIKSG